MTFTTFPLQKDRKPCSLLTLTKQSTTPLYLWSAAIPLWASWICSSILTLSRGATTVLLTAAEIPPATKSRMKSLLMLDVI